MASPSLAFLPPPLALGASLGGLGPRQLRLGAPSAAASRSGRGQRGVKAKLAEEERAELAPPRLVLAAARPRPEGEAECALIGAPFLARGRAFHTPRQDA
eukprot:8156726-Alexandrium_andersonii.AAC.1